MSNEDINNTDLPESESESDDISSIIEDQAEGEPETLEITSGIDDVDQEEDHSEIVEEEETGPVHYESEDFISNPVFTEGFSGNDDILQFHHSFGYDCQQYFNLCVADEENLIFLSGNLINIFNVVTKEMTFRRSAGGGGLGHITKNPKHPHIAVGEKGLNPLIIVYEWPSFDIVCILRNGTTRVFTHLNYSPDGDMLCSQGGDPDFLITIWNWETSQIILRTKSHGQDVINVAFSLYCPGQLVSSGLGHIKFWKMASTFTGLKLQGELGRFGKSEICDIVGIFGMPDEKVLSGSEWGNILVWEAGLIKLEVRQGLQKPCHVGEISQIHYCSETNHVTTVGMDGWIKMWSYSVIKLADPHEDDRFLEMHPLYEIQLKDSIGTAKIRSIVKKKDSLEDFVWFAQDSNGGIFSVSLNPSDPVQHVDRLYVCHPGKVIAIATSPVSHDLATLGEKGFLRIYNVMMKTLILQKQFCAGGTSLIWLPPYVEASGSVLVGGFSDGQIRVIVASIKEKEIGMFRKSAAEYINIIQISKPHTAAVNKIILNPRGSILVTGGADSTIFIYQIIKKHLYVTLQPTGFVDVPGPISYIAWKPKHNATALLCCHNGYFVEMVLPERKSLYNNISYQLEISRRELRFVSVKSEILRAELLKDMDARKQANLEKRKLELEKVKAENPGLDIDEDLFLEETEEDDEPLPPLYYPESPPAILFAKYTPDGTIWVSPAGYDAGYVYEYLFAESLPIRNEKITDAEDVELHSFLEIFHGEILVLGFANGKIRLVDVNEDEHYNMSSYWELAMHDNDNGIINQFALSYDKSMLFSCGNDGNVFSFCLTTVQVEMGKKSLVFSFGIPMQTVCDVDGKTQCSLEETKKNAENMKHLELVNHKKGKVLNVINGFKQRFDTILISNEELPLSQKLPRSNFELDPRITKCIQDKIDAEYNLLHQQNAFITEKSRLRLRKMNNYFLAPVNTLTVIVHAISNDFVVKSFLHRKLSDAFILTELDIDNQLHKPVYDFNLTENPSDMLRNSVMLSSTLRQTRFTDTYLSGHSELYKKLDIRTLRLLRKVKMQKSKREQRVEEWEHFYEIEPDINVIDPEDLKSMRIASQNIGDFKLKTDDDYHVPESQRVTTFLKFAELLKIQREIFNIKHRFNKKVLELREGKILLVHRIKQMLYDLQIIQSELSPENRKELPRLDELNLEHHFPEDIFKISKEQDPNSFVPTENPYDEEFFMLKIDKENPVSLGTDQKFSFTAKFSIEELEVFTNDDDEDTPYEEEMKKIRMMRMLYTQDSILRDLKLSVELFDQTIEHLSIERQQVAIDVKYLEVHYLIAYQEFNVIESYSAREDDLFKKIGDSAEIKDNKVAQVNSLQYDMDLKVMDVQTCEDKISDLQKEFTEMVENNQFATFLSRIFRKKIKIQRESTLSDSDSDSSSSEDDEDEMDEYDDDDSPDFIPIRLDKNVCPPGCDQALFDRTIQMRDERYEMENDLAEEKKKVEAFEKQLEADNKVLDGLDDTLQKNVRDLKILQREKQRKLNAIEGLVILNLSQMQHFASNVKMQLLKNTVLFSDQQLIQLHRRVLELEEETKLEKIKFKKHQKHKNRLAKETQLMKDKVKSLKKTVIAAKVQKYGRPVNEIKMEETVLRQMILESRLQSTMHEFRSKMNYRISQAKEENLSYSEELANLLRENTKSVKLLAMLVNENSNLVQLLREQKLEKNKNTKFKDYEDDLKSVNKLETVLQQQMIEKEDLLRVMELLKHPDLPDQ